MSKECLIRVWWDRRGPDWVAELWVPTDVRITGGTSSDSDRPVRPPNMELRCVARTLTKWGAKRAARRMRRDYLTPSQAMRPKATLIR